MRTRHLQSHVVTNVIPSFSAQKVSPDSPDYQEAQRLRGQRFERATKPSAHGLSSPKPLSDDISPIIIRQQVSGESDPIVATAAIEKASVGTIQTMIRFQHGSRSSQVMERGAFVLLRGVALALDVDQGIIPDVFDTLGHCILHLAQQDAVEWLWVVPRRPIVALARADIPGVLPPLHFAPCPDVSGWAEGEGLHEIRQLQLKELSTDEDTLPPLFHISLAQLADDLNQRLALLKQRRSTKNFSRLLWEAARQANKQVVSELALLNRQSKLATNHFEDRQERNMALFTNEDKKKKQESPASTLTALVAPPQAPESTAELTLPNGRKPSFLPVAASSSVDQAAYLRQVMEQGGRDAQRYKALSYDLLQLEPGQQVLDVGCGIGVDLPALAERVGKAGLVIGLDHNPELVQEATKSTAEHHNVRVVLGEAGRLPFPHESFDRVRADRVLQHIPDLKQVLAEIHRVLRPGGVLTIVEPDWKAVALHPGSPVGNDDDHTLHEVLAYKQQVSAHALVGRQLSSLLRQQGGVAWEGIRVFAEVFTFTAWPVVDAGLLISGMAEELAKEKPALANEINAWLKAIEATAERGEFLATMQLFYAYAGKVTPSIE